MAKTNVRVIIPKNPADELNLAKKISDKHTADGANSPLKALVDFNWTDNAPKVTQALALQVQIDQMEKDLETLYNKRNVLLVPVDGTVKASRDTLLGIYKANYKKLGDWGFVVDDTPKAKKKPKTPPAA